MKPHLFVSCLLCAVALAACSSDDAGGAGGSDAGADLDAVLDGGADADAAGDADGAADGSVLTDATEVLEDSAGDGAGDVGGDVPEPPANAWPCTDSQYWPLSVASETLPVLVHYRPGEEDVAREVLGDVETAWQVEVTELGFTAPLPDGGACGPDERFDVFLWGGIIESYVDVIADVPETAWDDYTSYLVVDPYGPYGGDALDATVAHELNHACQAADDWWETPIVFEMTSTFMEEVVFDDDDGWKALLEDFQAHPDWSFDYDDGYETWYMYAASLYLIFLQEHVFGGDASFVAEMWRGARNPPGADEDPALNEPDFEDVLEGLLQEEAGIGFLDSVLTFARWRWFVGARDDGAHFAEGASFPEEAAVAVAADVAPGAGSVDLSPAPMLLGSAYVRVASESATSFTVALDAPGSAGVRWVVQALPGLEAGSDGEVVELGAEPVRVSLDEAGERILVVTALPSGDNDPDGRSTRRHSAALVIGE